MGRRGKRDKENLRRAVLGESITKRLNDAATFEDDRKNCAPLPVPQDACTVHRQDLRVGRVVASTKWGQWNVIIASVYLKGCDDIVQA
jgi:hypothetical protein